MKFLSFVLALLLSAAPGFAQIRPHVTIQPESIKLPQSAVNLPALKKRVQTPQKDTAREQALQKLAERQNPKNWKEISWQDFLQQNKHTKGVETVSTHLDIKCTENFCRLLPAAIPIDLLQQTGNSEVDYKKILEGHKLIFVAEGMNHNTKRAPQEMAKILRAVREKNPSAKILFAAEFLEWENYNNLPELTQALAQIPNVEEQIQYYQAELEDWNFQYQLLSDEDKTTFKKQYDQQKQELAAALQQAKEWKSKVISLQTAADLKREPLLKKAGEKSDLYFPEEYAPAFKAADQLGIDQLALDDDIPGMIEDQVAAKVGEFVVWTTPEDKVPTWKHITKRRASAETKRFYALRQVLSVSPWGVRERNREWARRIKAVLPLYDIVLVYAGQGHLDTTYHMDLQPMLEQKTFMNITLYPMEELPQDIEEYYAQRHHATERNGITQDQQLWNTKTNGLSNIHAEDLIDESHSTQSQWNDSAKPFWIWMNGNDQELETGWDPEKAALFDAEMERQRQEFPYKYAASTLEVYLPAE
ncbi:MAG: hypothetical protein J6J74_05015 [Elusimicrobiaceae bacterium]|nr:hypothetical protein [Elusimicrobiaceae bacterium]